MDRMEKLHRCNLEKRMNRAAGVRKVERRGVENGKRTPDNCELIKRMGEPGKDTNGKCMGFGIRENDDEACESCKKCKYCTSYEED